MPFTAIAANQAKPKSKAYKLAVEKGLYLQVMPNGSKYWRLKYRFGGKEKVLALGVHPETNLKLAREKREEARKLLSNGIDPSDVKRAQKAYQCEAAGNSFQAIALEWFARKMADKSQGHQNRTMRALEKDLFPMIGSHPIGDITPPQLLAALRRIESRGAVETAYRAKQTAGQIFRYAVATGRAERDPSHDLKGALAIHKKKHLAAITDPKEVGKLLMAIDQYIGTPTVKAALQLSPLLFQRPGEIRQMEWAEIDWDKEQWELPAEKMKMGQPHIVPLSKQSLDILQDIQRLNGNRRYVFPSARGASRPLSENGVRTALRTMGYDNDTMTPHGFRAMARTILDEVLGFRPDHIEHQLAHAVRDPNGRAYNRTKHLDQRRKMMQSWADYLNSLKLEASTSNVVAGKFKGSA
ncbi:MAG: integrase [Porticoccus sp.]|jgi:integrase|uniref:tyrosine-type recombinase/integrase n=1 Tax=Porticoccus sp. TaxID=2024853 RepID=UPI0039E36471